MLLAFFAVLLTAAAAVSIKALNHSSARSQLDRDKLTAAALAQAKDALIGYAITYGDIHPGNVHGYLPCPDTSGTDIGGEGSAAGNCGSKNVSAIGRLPWKTLDLGPLHAGDNECLWYAVSGTYKNNPKTDLMNWDTNGQLQVYASDGITLLTPADNQAVAVIIAPGTALSGQNRVAGGAPLCGGNYTASNYLDSVGTFNNASVSAVANATSQLRIGDPALPTSDRMVFITRQDIWNAMQRRKHFLDTLDNMTQQAALCIAGFGFKNSLASNHSLPWPAPLYLTDYTDNARYNDHENLYAGRIPYKVNTSQSPTHNLIGSPYYLLQADGANCPTPTQWAAVYPWWDNWKDHLFYAISQRFHPDSSATPTCDSAHCLSVNPGNPGNNAAIVIFANKKLSGKSRTDKSVVADYLEGRNATNMTGYANGNENYQAETPTTPPSTTFNDIVYCIKYDLTVVKGTTAGCP